MAEKKPRLVVEDLKGGLPQVTPAADPRTANNYYRPQDQEVMRPTLTNPMSQLADSLSKMEPNIQRFSQTMGDKWNQEDYAKAEADFLGTSRDKWTAMIKSGQIPPGASPYAERGWKRTALKQLGEEYRSQTLMDFHGEAGAKARAENNPAAMREFLDNSFKKFNEEWLKDGYFSPLDRQEVLHPAIEQANTQLMREHAAHRVKEVQQQYEDTVSVMSENILDQELGQLTPTMSDEERGAVTKKAATRMMDLLYNHDTGLVRNLGNPKRGSDLIIESALLKAKKTGNRSFLSVIDHLTTQEGHSLAKTSENQAKMIAAEEHITNKEMQLAHFNHWQAGLPFEAASKERQQQSWEKEDQRWDREVDSWRKQDGKLAEEEVSTSLTRRIYEGLRSKDAKRGTAIIDSVIREAEQIQPKEAEKLRNLVHTLTKQQSDYTDDNATKSQLRLEISRNPLAFDMNRIDAAVRDKMITAGTAMQLFDDLERNRQNGDHAFLRQPEFSSMMHKVEKSMAQSMGDDEFGEGALRAVDAHGDFRDLALEWIEKNPQGSAAAFNNYMRSQIQAVAERNNEPYGAAKKAERKTQTERGQMVVDKTKQDVNQKEETRRQAEEVTQKKQAEEKRHKDEIDHFNQNFKPSGKKTKDGRQYLVGPNGDVATEQTITINGVPEINGGGITNIPTIFNGKKYSDQAAVEIMRQNKGKDPDTGKPLKRYYSIKDAEIAAREKSNRLGKEWKQHSTEPAAEPKAELPTGPVKQYGKITPTHLRTLLTGEQKTEIVSLRNRILKPGIEEKPVTEEQLKDRVMEMLKPIYKDAGASPAELVDGVTEFLRVLLPKQDKKKG